MTSKALLILGMHRSGTSCLTGQLEEAGIWLGDVRRSSAHNAKGNRENPQIMVLNEAVLNDNGGAWDAPPHGDIRWNSTRLAKQDRILSTYPSDKVWAFKDPRTLFTLESWRARLPAAKLVGTIRHPLAVARSLNARSKMPIEKGLSLWTQYNARLLQIAREEEFPIVSFDMPTPQYLAATGSLLKSLDLIVPASGSVFFDESLRHQAADNDIELSRDTTAIYAALCERITS